MNKFFHFLLNFWFSPVWSKYLLIMWHHMAKYKVYWVNYPFEIILISHDLFQQNSTQLRMSSEIFRVEQITLNKKKTKLLYDKYIDSILQGCYVRKVVLFAIIRIVDFPILFHSFINRYYAFTIIFLMS